ncbi:hypothetical protein V7S43_009262 [Phytophthora oleae]|uniref:Uncharacterized protein n=1 Tax=Phytophthora oleae TaxID=2107226 RepID=A0ABD3FFX0_9STRA
MQSLLDVELVRIMRRALGPAPRPADYLEVLQTFAGPLTAIPLPTECDVDTAQAFRDTAREEIMLNGVRFVGDHRTEAFVAAIKRIISEHVGGDEHPERALLVADRVMRGCSRTLSGADSFFAVHELFAAPELLIKPRGASGVPLDVTLGRDYEGTSCTGLDSTSSDTKCASCMCRPPLQVPYQVCQPLRDLRE